MGPRRIVLKVQSGFSWRRGGRSFRCMRSVFIARPGLFSALGFKTQAPVSLCRSANGRILGCFPLISAMPRVLRFWIILPALVRKWSALILWRIRDYLGTILKAQLARTGGLNTIVGYYRVCVLNILRAVSNFCFRRISILNRGRSACLRKNFLRCLFSWKSATLFLYGNRRFTSCFKSQSLPMLNKPGAALTFVVKTPGWGWNVGVL